MAQYKLIQDIEAEDKLIGPLTLKGFIYALVAGLCAFIDFRLIISGFGLFKWIFIIILFLPIVLFGLLASPLGREQPTEIWLLSRIKFFLKPRKRIWDPDGPIDLVKITAPKRVENALTKHFNQTEIQGRLTALASTLDSRGWAIKNVNLSLPAVQSTPADDSSDRLIDAQSVTQGVPDIDVTAADDILDEKNNPTAQHVQGLINKADVDRRKSMMQKMDKARYETPAETKPVQTRKVQPRQAARNVQQRPPATKQANPTPEPAKAIKLELSKSANDLTVASIAQLASHAATFQQLSPTEGVVTLH